MSEQMLEGYRLSPQQRRVWGLQQADDAAAYGVRCAFLIEGPLDESRLRAAAEALVERHEILRTAFELLPGAAEPVQVIGEGRLAWAEPRDLRGLDARAQESEVEAVLSRRGGESGTVRPVEAVLFRLGEESHALGLSLSALCLDAAGARALVSELGGLYGGAAAPESDETLQYADLSEWQNELLESDEIEDGRRRWQREGLAELLDVQFPLEGRRRGRARGFSPRGRAVTLDAETGERVASLAARLGVSEEAFWLACWRVLVWRMTGRAEFAIGAASDGRSHDGLEGAVGLLTRYLPLDAETDGRVSFSELAAEAERRLAEARQWQDFFSWEQAAPARADAAGRAPEPHYCAVCFDFVNAPEGRAAAGARYSLWRDYTCAERFKLRLSVMRRPDSCRATIHYDESLFEADEIERISARLLRLAAGAAASPETAVARLPLLPDEERRAIVEGFNPVSRVGAGVECIHRRIEAQARRRPHAVAVVSEEESLTYDELNRGANRLARLLKGLGVGPEVRVGVLLERSSEMIVALLAVLKAGGVYVPIDPNYPPDRAAYMLENAGARVLLTRTEMAERLPEHGAHVLRLDAEAEGLARQSDENPESGVGEDNLAYVIYTSGSTGRPKGVGVTHRNVARLFDSTARWFDFGEEDVWTFFHSYAFDFSVWEIWGALVYGGRLVVVSYWVSRSPEEFYKLLCSEGVTVLNQTPSSFRQLIRAEESADFYGDLALRLVVFGGEALEFQSLRPWFDRHGDEQPRLVNMYGITETTVHVTYFPLTIADLHKHSGSVIGAQIPDLRLYVLDEHSEPAPVGVAGELYVGGEGLARGYLNRPGLTAERFVPDSHSGEAGARLYRTGDLARHLPGGALEYLGRADNQVKIRGFRIELGEIEAALASYADVAEAAAAVRADASGDKRIVGYFVPRAGAVDAAGLRAHLRGRLPEYMLPSQFVALERLPLTPNGKVDRKALPEPAEAGGADEGGGYVAPRTPAEELVCGIWSEVLGVERVGVSDNFFDLGGHSLLAARVAARVREAFGVELPLRSLFESPTPAELAVSLEAARRGGEGAPPPMTRVGRDGALPLSYAQERLWFLHRLEPESPSYNVPFGIRLRGRLDTAALEATFGAVVARHESLRTTFPAEGGVATQLIHDPAPFRLPLTDLSHLANEEREAETLRQAREESLLPFDLSVGPLLRARLLRLDEEEHVLLLTMHHIVSDGWSVGVLVREVSALYDAYSRGQGAPLPELEVQYADYAVWQRGWLEGGEMGRQLAYWKERLAGAPAALELPTDRPRPAAGSYRGASMDFRLNAELTAGLRRAAHAEGATLFMALLACWQVLLARYSGQDEVVVGSPVANRGLRELESLIGFFVNTLVLRGDVSGDPSLREVVRRAREVCLGAYEHQDVPFERLVEELRPERSLGRSPLFQVMFSLNAGRNVLNAGRDAAPSPGGLLLESVRPGGVSSKFDLTLTLEEDAAGRLAGTLAYSTDLFDEASMSRLLAAYERVLTAAVEDLGQPAWGVPLLGEEERRAALASRNQTRRDYERGRLVHELFEARAAGSPAASAVVSEGGEFNYAELNAHADALARRLRVSGVGPEVFVGVMTSRPAEMVAGALAVLKAGGACVPLDPEQPREVLAEMLDAARVEVILTERGLAGRLPESAARVVLSDATQPEGGGAEAGAAHLDATAAGAAWVSFVPAPGGRVAAVVNTHEAIRNACDWMAEAGLVAEGDRVLGRRPLQQATAAELLSTLTSGATLVTAESRESLRGEGLRRLVNARDVTVAHCSAEQLADLSEAGAGETFGSLRRVVCNGPTLSEGLRARFSKVSAATLCQLHGPAGAAGPATFRPCEDEAAGPFTPAGRPVANTRAYVLDRFLEPAPVGVVGALFVGGEGVARGYLGRPGLTAEQFVPDPHSGEAGARLQRTGDLARYLPDGSVELSGRRGRVASAGGFRIDLDRVEAALLGHAAVRRAAVVQTPGASGAARLVGYVVARGAAPAAAELSEHLSKSLPDYATPSAYVVLDDLPLTWSGSVDFGALPPPPSGAAADSFAAAATPLEELVAGVWREVLGVERVGVNDNFFDLGGRSLLITQAHSRLEQLLGRELALVELFKYPTVGALAEYLGGGETGDALVAQGDERAETRRTSMRRRRNLRQTA